VSVDSGVLFLKGVVFLFVCISYFCAYFFVFEFVCAYLVYIIYIYIYVCYIFPCQFMLTGQVQMCVYILSLYICVNIVFMYVMIVVIDIGLVSQISSEMYCVLNYMIICQ
jgi:hypothetical protein